mgnify:CR=1 FL=1|tara:strand:+ start:503 stop:778 length:276 start_codon:yes stop_codon:yes gene_type:complete
MLHRTPTSATVLNTNRPEELITFFYGFDAENGMPLLALFHNGKQLGFISKKDMIEILFDGWGDAADAIGDDEMRGPIDNNEEYYELWEEDE